MSCRRTAWYGSSHPQKCELSVVDLVHQQVVTDQQRLLHRLRRDLEGLHDEGDDEDRDDNRRGERLQRVHAAGMAAGAEGFPPVFVSAGRSLTCGSVRDFAHDGSEDSPEDRERLLQNLPSMIVDIPRPFVQPLARPASWCCPSLRRTNPLSPSADAATCASMVNSLRWSGPSSLTST